MNNIPVSNTMFVYDLQNKWKLKNKDTLTQSQTQVLSFNL